MISVDEKSVEQQVGQSAHQGALYPRLSESPYHEEHHDVEGGHQQESGSETHMMRQPNDETQRKQDHHDDEHKQQKGVESYRLEQAYSSLCQVEPGIFCPLAQIVFHRLNQLCDGLYMLVAR